MPGDESALADGWRALSATWPGYILTVDGENRLRFLNRSTNRIDAERDLGRDLFDFIAAEAEAEWRADLAIARAGHEAKTRRFRIQRADGNFRWYDSRFIGLKGSSVLIVSTDVTEEESAKAGLRLMAEASREFSEATADYPRLLRVIAQRLAEIVGDLCSIRAMNEAGTELEGGAVYHRDPDILALAEHLGQTYSQRLGEGASGKVAQTGKPLLIPKVALAEFAAAAAPQYRELLLRMNVGSLIIIPMFCRGQVAGVATLLRSGSDQPYTEQDVQLVAGLADHAALAITNSRSYAAERAARAAAVQANEALQKSELAHRLLFESSPMPLVVLDVETLDLLAVNDAAARLYEYSRDELLRMNLRDLLPPEGKAGAHERVAALGDSEAVGLSRHVRRDGAPFFAEHASRILLFNGRKARFTLILDVTARHEAEQMRALLAAIVQSSNDAIVSQRLDGTITSWNQAAQRLFGYSSLEAINQPIALVIPPERLAEARELQARVAAGERVEHFETVRRRKDGSEFAISLSVAPIFDTSGKVVGASKTGRDLTALRTAEESLRTTGEQLRQAQKMEAVGRLAGGIAHDFNNLLSVILSYSELLLQDVPRQDPASADLGEIRKAALHAADLTRQLLVFSRKQVVTPKVLDLNEVLVSVDKMVRRIIGEDVDLVSSPGANLWRVRADRGNVEQAILNLVVNARDAMPTGGKLTVETGNVELDLDYTSRHAGATPGPHVMLAVSDTGVGMDRVTQQRIFEPFFTTKPVGQGTGLGLSTVFGIAQQSGGTVWVYSEPGKGATFKLYFPAVQAELERLGLSIGPPALRGTETILLVEDQEQVRAVAHGILQRSGYQVLVAQHADEALLFCEMHEGPIHLLLTDVVMPQMSGAELATRAARTRPSIKVLYMSGYTDDSIVRHGILESEMAFLQKPFTPESLTHKIREVLATP